WGICWVTFSPDGQRLATSSNDQTVKIWEATSRQELLTLRGHRDKVRRVAFSADGQWLVSVSADGTARVWEARPLTPEQRLQREAGALVNRLTAELLIKEDVLQRLRQDPSLPEPVRKYALTFLERYREDHQELLSTIWPVISKPGMEPEKY